MESKVECGGVMKTTVIKIVDQLDKSLSDLLFIISLSAHDKDSKCVVGLGVKKVFRPSASADDFGGNNQFSERVAVLKLCYGTRCLFIQLLNLKVAPCSLSKFLQLQGLSFVDVGIKHCLEALERDYGIKCRNAVDLGQLAATLKKKEEYRGYSLMHLAKEFCTSEVVDHLMYCFNATALTNWSDTTLSQKEIEAASFDAFICFYIGNNLFGVFLLS